MRHRRSASKKWGTRAHEVGHDGSGDTTARADVQHVVTFLNLKPLDHACMHVCKVAHVANYGCDYRSHAYFQHFPRMRRNYVAGLKRPVAPRRGHGAAQGGIGTGGRFRSEPDVQRCPCQAERGSARGAEMLKSRSRRAGWSSNALYFWSSGMKISREQTENAFRSSLLHTDVNSWLGTKCPET